MSVLLFAAARGEGEAESPGYGASFPSYPGIPTRYQLYVVGGFGSWMGMICGGAIATEKIELPANWGKLVEKYKDFVPTYVVY